MEKRTEDQNTQADYAKDIVCMIDQMPQGEAEKRLLRRVWKIICNHLNK